MKTNETTANTTPKPPLFLPPKGNPYKRKPILSATVKKAKVLQKKVTNPYPKSNPYKIDRHQPTIHDCFNTRTNKPTNITHITDSSNTGSSIKLVNQPYQNNDKTYIQTVATTVIE